MSSEFDSNCSACDCVGAALVWAARSAAFRLPLVAVATLFSGAHAVLHVHDTLRGLVDSHHWWLDLPSIYLPAIVLITGC